MSICRLHKLPDDAAARRVCICRDPLVPPCNNAETQVLLLHKPLRALIAVSTASSPKQIINTRSVDQIAGRGGGNSIAVQLLLV